MLVSSRISSLPIGDSDTTNCSIGSAYSLYLDNVRNPPSVIDVEEPITIYTFTKESYYIERGITPNYNELFS